MLLMIPSNIIIGPRSEEIPDALRYFTEVTAPALINHDSHYLWNCLVLQASYQDESIKHLLVAVSALDQRQRSRGEPLQHRVVHQYHYSKALQILASCSNLDTGVILTACLLCVICDELQQNRFSALQHIIAGRNILGDYCNQHSSTQYSTTVEELGPIFRRLELQTGELDQETLPLHIRWPYSSQRPASPGPNLPKSVLGRRPPLSYGFLNVSTAGKCLQALASSCMKPRPETPPPATVFHVVPDVTTQLNEWLSHFESTCSRLDAKQATADMTRIHVLRMYHLCLSIMSRCAPFDDEMLYDQHLSQLEHIIVKATIMLSTDNSGSLAEKLLPAIFFVAAHYRDVTFRMRALSTLRQCGWEGIRLATIAEQIMEIEGTGYADAIVAADIPWTNRIRAFEVIFSDPEFDGADDRGVCCTLVFSTQPYGSLSSIKSHTFKWEDVTDKALQGSVSRSLGRMLNFDFLSTGS